MIKLSPVKKSIVTPALIAAVVSVSVFNNAVAEDNETGVAFPDKYMLRMGAYSIKRADTQFSVNTSGGVGTSIDYQRDLGGDSSNSIPRIDAYYRFNDRHRIDFTTFNVDRKGTRTISLDLTIGEENYSANETIHSDIDYTLYKVAYSYSFYHTPKVELSLSAGINITTYDLAFSNDGGDKVESAGVTVPLPVFGLRVSYAITPKWSVHYITETFFIEFEDSVRGSLYNHEINTEYRVLNNLSLGAGFARFGTDIEVFDDDWKGSVSDNYQGFTLFGALYF